MPLTFNVSSCTELDRHFSISHDVEDSIAALAVLRHTATRAVSGETTANDYLLTFCFSSDWSVGGAIKLTHDPSLVESISTLLQSDTLFKSEYEGRHFLN